MIAPAEQLEILAQSVAPDSFSGRLSASGLAPLTATGVNVLQMNITRCCNLVCRHCHVDASPLRTEIMAREVMDACVSAIHEHQIATVDITGGAPEMHPDLGRLLEAVCETERRVIVRTNLVILLEEPWRKFLETYCRLGVELVASLPDFRAARTDRMRGFGVFESSIEVLRELNRQGYGQEDSGLILNLMHNPIGAFLPGKQAALEAEYCRHLRDEFGIVFNRLLVLANSPINRYFDYLQQSGNLEQYMRELRCAFNPLAARRVMCRTMISVAADGGLYDCDFNQMLGLRIGYGAPDRIADFSLERLQNRAIAVRDHCYACCAGDGSSCQGAFGSEHLS